jgi:hypothetical protein
MQTCVPDAGPVTEAGEGAMCARGLVHVLDDLRVPRVPCDHVASTAGLFSPKRGVVPHGDRYLPVHAC